MSFSRVALIGFGEVGQVLARDLAKAGVGNVAAYDLLFSDSSSKPARALTGGPVRAAASHADAVRDAELVFCAVTAASDLDAARAVAPAIGKGAYYLDLNSASPGVKQEASRVIDAAGGAYIEAAVMTPIHPHGLASNTLIGGAEAAAFLARAEALGVRMRVASPNVGVASATKMCRSVIIKGLESLLTESMISARHYGVEDAVLASLSDLLPVGDWNKLAAYMISRSLEHGGRRAEEMREVAVTVREAGVEPLMSTACAQRQDWSAAHRAALRDQLGPMLDALLADLDAGQKQRAP